ncbi:unnamed protein product [Amoebophrya sp. A120]|nr:unnamed protein product [Amoebophrya sp. A120]|eukprot:GSA120T00021348001.1
MYRFWTSLSRAKQPGVAEVEEGATATSSNVDLHDQEAATGFTELQEVYDEVPSAPDEQDSESTSSSEDEEHFTSVDDGEQSIISSAHSNPFVDIPSAIPPASPGKNEKRADGSGTAARGGGHQQAKTSSSSSSSSYFFFGGSQPVIKEEAESVIEATPVDENKAFSKSPDAAVLADHGMKLIPVLDNDFSTSSSSSHLRRGQPPGPPAPANFELRRTTSSSSRRSHGDGNNLVDDVDTGDVVPPVERRKSSASKLHELLSPVLPKTSLLSRASSSSTRNATTSTRNGCSGRKQKAEHQSATSPQKFSPRIAGATSGSASSSSTSRPSAARNTEGFRDHGKIDEKISCNQPQDFADDTTSAGSTATLSKKTVSKDSSASHNSNATTSSSEGDLGPGKLLSCSSWKEVSRGVKIACAVAVSGDLGATVQEYGVQVSLIAIITLSAVVSVQILRNLATFWKIYQEPGFQAIVFCLYLGVYLMTSFCVQTYFFLLYEVFHGIYLILTTFAAESGELALSFFPVSYVLVVLAWLLIVPGLLPGTLVVVLILAFVVAMWAMWVFQAACTSVMKLERKYEAFQKRRNRAAAANAAKS